MRIALISSGQPSRNPRLVKEVEALTGAGHDVIVVHGQVLPAWVVDDRKLLAACAQVIEVPFGRASAGLLRHLLQKICVLLSALGRHLVRGELASVFAAVVNSPVTPGLILAARSVRADLYIAHYIPALPAAAIAARRFCAPFAFDAEDFHTGDPPSTESFRREREVIRQVEAHFLPQAKYMTAASPGIADAYAETWNIQPTVILNTFSRCLAPDSPVSTKLPRSVYWFSQTIGPNRGLETLIRAIGQTETEIHIYLRGDPKPGYWQTLAQLAGEHGVEERLHRLVSAPAPDMVKLCQSYDVGYVGETGYTRNRDIALTNKQFTYFLAGLPTVMSDVTAHQAFADEAAGAVFLFQKEDEKSLAEQLDHLLGSSDLLQAAREAAWQYGQTTFNWETEAVKLLELVTASVGEQRAT